MMERMAVLAALIALTGCAGMQSAGRNAQRADAPTAVESEAPPPATLAAPPAAAPAQSMPPPPPAQAAEPTETASAEDDDAIVVPGQREMQVPPPNGDPRSTGERMEDVRAWDQCITQVQSAFERDPMRPQLDSPEEYCSRSLGMASRTAVPVSRRP